jgi:hypothetical protein
MIQKKQIWVSAETKDNLINLAKKQNCTIMHLMKNLSEKGRRKYE